MQPTGNPAKHESAPVNEPHIPFGSNEVRLSPRQWAVAGIILAASFYALPIVWEAVEPLDTGRDYRVPYPLGHDYWHYSRCCRRVAAEGKTPVIGDSVVWGHYVAAEQTLSHYLNELAGEDRFANLGVDGIHPAAMAGLIEHYGRAVRETDVILHCNLLWISSEQADLHTRKERRFNHPQLVPQLFPRIPCYRESVSRRLGIAIGHRVPLLAWAKHLRIAYFEDRPELRRWTDFPTWTIAHPYDDPIGAVTLQLPSPNEPPSPKPDARPWTAPEKHMTKLNPAWVQLDTSIQWRFFRRTVDILRQRGNRVFVLVGPFNEHMLTDESLRTYAKRKGQVEAWLGENNVAHYVPAALPSGHYADPSHPLAEGYALLAKRLFEHEAFVKFLEGKPPRRK